MSHLKEREEKNCLNCGAAIYGRYCHVCGQENLEPKESFWHLVTHFVYDIIHFDGKFFSTLKYLLFWPGHLSHEYLKGRRMSYLHPIKMYVFTSAFFFLIFFSFYKELNIIQTNTTTTSSNASDILKELKSEKVLYEKLLESSLPPQKIEEIKTRIILLDSDIVLLQRDTTKKGKLLSDKDGIPEISTSISVYSYKSLKEYDSVQASLPASKKDGRVKQFFERLDIKKRIKYGNDNAAYWESLKENFTHHFPQLLFTSLPLFALLLKLLYRRRKQFFYINHAIFTIHLYCATFIITLLRLWTMSIFELFHSQMPTFLRVIFALIILFYWYKAFRNFYEQRRAKTILKFIILMFLTMIMMVLLFALFLFFSAITV